VSIDTLGPRKSGEDKTVRDVLVTLRESNAGSVEISLGYGDYENSGGRLILITATSEDITGRLVSGRK